MFNLRLRDIARRPNAPFLGAQAGTSGIGRSLELFELEAVVPEGKITEGLGALMTEAKRVQQYGFSADELSRAKAAMLAGYERAYKERETSESANYANEYVRHFLQKEPIPGMEFEYKIAATYLPTITGDESRRARQGTHHRRESRRPRRRAGEEGRAAAVDRHAARGDHSRRHRAGRALGGSDRRPRARRETAGARQGRVDAGPFPRSAPPC